MGFLDTILKGFLGNKNEKDLKEVKKVVEKIKKLSQLLENFPMMDLEKRPENFNKKFRMLQQMCVSR